MKRLLVVVLLALLVLTQVPEAQGPTTISLATGASSGSGTETAKSLTLANSVVSSTLTARNVSGTLLSVEPTQWSVVSAPAANSQATASIANEAAVRHVARCISWSASSGAAVTAANGSIVLRDGATGAGTIIWQLAIAHLVAAGAGVQTIAPNTVCGINLVGTTNTAMTAEFNAGVTGETQAITLMGFNIN